MPFVLSSLAAAVWAMSTVCCVASLTTSLPLPPYVTAVNNLTQVHAPPVSPLQSKCMVGFDDATIAFPLASIKVLLVATIGSDTASVTTAYQYYSARGADITLYCGDLSVIPAEMPMPLLDTYFPTYTLSRAACWSGTTLLDGSTFDVMVIPSGFEAVLNLRAVDVVFQIILTAFALAPDGHPRALVVIDEGAEVLVEPRLLSAAPMGSKFPSTTPTIPLAIAALGLPEQRIAVVGNISQALLALVPTANVSSAGLHVAVTANGTVGGTIPLLVTVSREVLEFHGDLWAADQVSVDCSDANMTTPFTYPTAIFVKVAEDASLSTEWGPLTNRGLFGANLSAGIDADNVIVDLTTSCLNEQGVNTCAGKKYGVVVAHGTHDLQLLGLLRGFAAVGASPELYCPDRDELQRTVYAMPIPPLFPSFAVTCTHYYNESYIVFDDSILIVGGAIATHRRLRLDKPLLQALDQAPSFALFGTALVMLQTIHVISVSGNTVIDTPVVPQCPFTNTDLEASGFTLANSTTFAASNASTGVLQYRDHVTKQRQRELGGYEYINATFVSFPLFIQQVLSAQAWNQQQTSSIDKVVGALFISVAVLTVVGVLGFKIVQRRLKKSRGSQYVAVSREDDDTSLY